LNTKSASKRNTAKVVLVSSAKNMKSRHNYIGFILIFNFSLFLILSGISNFSFAQGYNENEWIFGNCGTGDNNYLSFGKGNTATVQTLPGSILIGKNNNAIAIDPITGQPLFYTNGEFVYDYSGEQVQGNAPGLNGNFEGRQTVATGFLDYDPNGNKLFYIFYLTLGGQLQYALVDMNAPGQATGNERPLGEIISKNITIGPGIGAILVIKTPSSPSYLISFAGGNLISRRLGSTSGEFTQTDTEGISFTPKAIVFDEKNSSLLLIPENPGDDLLVIPFDSSSGNFGTPKSLSNSGGPDAINGAEFSPDGSFIYFTRGNKLFRVPSTDLDATPEEMPLSTGLHQVYDLKVGPDGQLYYIYEENPGGPQLIGRLTNPNEKEFSKLVLEGDPFNGTDFCGTVFPIFAPNADINPTVDFTWNPTEPCAKNPIQLTSEITPQNYRPVSFTWEFDPPLTDSDGNPLPADFKQEHFLVPKDAAQESSISVKLVVEFGDGTKKEVTKSITLTENNLEANFSPSDTTLCESCIDLDPLLQAQAADGGGSGGSGGGSPGGGGQTYEYFWSNKRNEGWIGKGANEVCKPGLYWVLVREPGSSCYAYAEIRIKMWDIPDQSNNVWYFGNGAGLDFNPDPNDENAPVPRPIQQRHPQNIPAGTTTISDQAGQVLFFTDGQSVWDLNGNLMQNGNDIGGDNTSSQAVLAVGVPTEPTLFYLFTTQASSSGTNSVSYSLVDIKAENTTGVGNVVTKNNFLFSPSTEQIAALSAGDTTWVMFHELGNNSFRAYPVSVNGIGQPIISSVGSNHGFNAGVGAMKFSPDGTKVAVTISEGGCNKTEIFEFDQQTGRLTEYARLDLGCGGEVYGLEFSQDSDRILISFRNGVIQEFIIKQVDSDNPNSAPCPSCFDGVTNREQRENCIISTKKVLSGTSGLSLGALQIASDGQIYVAVVGDNRIGQIQVGTGCTASSSFNQNAVQAMPGNANLGLPSFVQNSGSSIPEPELSFPARLCLDPELGAEALLEGAGEPDIDSYFWTITHEDGTVIQNAFGGPGDQFQNLEQIFNRPGKYKIKLQVDRCAEVNYDSFEGEIVVVAPPSLTLKADETLCSGTPITLTAIDGYNPADGLYDFRWTNAAGQVLGDVNSNSITVDEESIYSVSVSYRVPGGLSSEEAAFFDVCPATAEVFVGPAFQFDLNQTAEEVCYEETSVTFAPNTPISGEWYYEKNNDGVRVPLGEFFELVLYINNLPGAGSYEIIFVTIDPILQGCVVEKKVALLVNELPLFIPESTQAASDCATADGAFNITMQASASEVKIPDLGLTFSNVVSGDVIPVSGVLPGAYTIEATNISGCTFFASVSIENLNPPSAYDFTVTETDEICASTGVSPGVLLITFTSGVAQSGTYSIVRQGDGQIFTGNIPNLPSFPVSVPHGEYVIELIDPAGCRIPDTKTYLIEQKFEVLFSVPTSVSACEEFLFTPTGPKPLNYAVTTASGNLISPNSNGEYRLTLSGKYRVRGEDPAAVDCPKEIEMDVRISQQIDFEISPPIVDCAAGLRYEAILLNALPQDVLFLWKDDLGVIVGRRQTFIPSRDGNYSLEVQPATGGLCPTLTKTFIGKTLTAALPLTLDIAPFCKGQTGTVLTVVADLSSVAKFEWYSVLNGTRTRLTQFDNLPLISVSQEGTYEVLLRSEFDCELGRANGVVVKSTIEPPVLPFQEATICAVEGNTLSINPGIYDNYSWMLDGIEVSKDAIFTPTKPGNYELIVSDKLGCEYSATFKIVEDCRLKVSYPNAVVLGDPNKSFILYANEYIDEIQVFIYNRWGELIYFCETENLEPKRAFCLWDGTVYGKFVPIGTYAVVVRFTSREQKLTQSETKAITIIQ